MAEPLLSQKTSRGERMRKPAADPMEIEARAVRDATSRVIPAGRPLATAEGRAPAVA